mgnify:CR=1 FL=1
MGVAVALGLVGECAEEIFVVFAEAITGESLIRSGTPFGYASDR